MVLLLGLGIVNENAMAEKSDVEAPIRTVSIILPEGSQDQFFAQLKKFSETYAFAIRIAPTTPDLSSFLIEMWRDDIKGLGTNALAPERFRIAFYQNGAEPVSEGNVNQIIAGLKKAIANVEGATVSESR